MSKSQKRQQIEKLGAAMRENGIAITEGSINPDDDNIAAMQIVSALMDALSVGDARAIVNVALPDTRPHPVLKQLFKSRFVLSDLGRFVLDNLS